MPVIVEAFRLLFTLATTAIGFKIGQMWIVWFPTTETPVDVSSVWGALIGAGIGYVAGGALGRVVRRGIDVGPQMLDKATGPQLFAGAFGIITGVIVGVVVAVPAVVLMPPVVGWPVGGLVVLVLAALGARVFASRAHDLLAATGLRARDPLRRQPLASEGPPRARYLVDSSAAIDGRILELARSGLLGDDVWVPAFVVDELQTIADSGDKSRRRRGRRGLDILDALRDVSGLDFVVLEESVPEQIEVDAKLLTLASRLEAALVTTDHNLARAAGLRGITVVNPHALGESMRPSVSSGDVVAVMVERIGSEPEQGVGFLDDGTMVVVSGGADSIGEIIEVEISNMLRTSVGRMVFARLAS